MPGTSRSLLAAAALIAAGAASAVYQQAAEVRDRRRFPPPGRLVGVGGRRLHLIEAGAGAPTVVIVPALADNVLQWVSIQRELASDTRVIVYDRAGIGWSDPPLRRRYTFDNAAADLHDLLAAARVVPPYVLAGHSLGGIVARRFADRYPDMVTGMVLLDSSHEDQVARLAVSGHGRRYYLGLAAKRQARILGMRRLAASLGVAHQLDADVKREAPPEFRAALRAIFLSSRQRRAVVRELLMLAGTSGDPPELGFLPLTVVTAADRDAGWVQLQDDLAALSACGSHITAPSAGHYVHLDDPGLVIEVIRDLVFGLRLRPVVLGDSFRPGVAGDEF